MRAHPRLFAAALLTSFAWLAACKAPPSSAPKGRSVNDLLATVPVGDATFWAPDFQAGLDAITGFIPAVTDANALDALDAFSARAGVDLRTARGWNALGLDTSEGVAVLTGNLAPPTLVVRTRDLVRFDKFINLYADARSETEGHAIGNVHGNTVHSYRGVHWSHVDGYTWLTVGRAGRVAMAQRLQHIVRENNVIAPDHALNADANFAADMNHVKQAAWMGRGHATPMLPGGAMAPGGAWAAALDIGPKGFDCQLFMASPTKSLPADTTSLDTLLRRYNAHDLIFSAGRYMDFNYATKPTPPARVLPQSARSAPHPSGLPQAAAAAPGDAVQIVDQFITRFTGLHWRDDVVPNVRGVTVGIGLAPEAAALENLRVALTVDVSDASRAASWLATTAQTMAQQNIVFKPTVQTASGTAFTAYRLESALTPWPGTKAPKWSLSAAVVGKSIVLALGNDTLGAMVNVLVNEQPPPSPWASRESTKARTADAHGFSVLRLGRLADVATRWMATLSPNDALPGNPDAQDKEAVAQGLKILTRLGDIVSTASEAPGGQVLEVGCDLTSMPDAPGPVYSPSVTVLPALQEILQPGAQSTHQHGATQSRDATGKDHSRLQSVGQHRKQQRRHKASDYK